MDPNSLNFGDSVAANIDTTGTALYLGQLSLVDFTPKPRNKPPRVISDDTMHQESKEERERQNQMQYLFDFYVCVRDRDSPTTEALDDKVDEP